MNPFDQLYQDGLVPWDIGRPQPVVARLVRQKVFHGEVLDVGCGTGENALYLASQGFSVLGIDFARSAIEQAQTKARERGSAAKFRVANALSLELLDRQFDGALDSATFHIFSDEERIDYARGLQAVLKPGGSLFIVCFSEWEPEGWGPRRVKQDEIRSTFEEGFTVGSIEEVAYEVQFRAQPVASWLAHLVCKP